MKTRRHGSAIVISNSAIRRDISHKYTQVSDAAVAVMCTTKCRWRLGESGSCTRPTICCWWCCCSRLAHYTQHNHLTECMHAHTNHVTPHTGVFAMISWHLENACFQHTRKGHGLGHHGVYPGPKTYFSQILIVVRVCLFNHHSKSADH